MFMQVIQGRASDRQCLRRQLDRWQSELRPGAEGYLGSTGGVTDDGRYLGCVRFESAEAARANSVRPEQGAWFAETEKCFDGPATFRDSTEVEVYLGGGSDQAGFVQVFQGGPAERDRLRQLNVELEAMARQYRPDIMGWVLAWHPDGHFTEIVYFNSEEAARQGEATEPPEERRHLIEEWRAAAGELTFFDLKEPWLSS